MFTMFLIEQMLTTIFNLQNKMKKELVCLTIFIFIFSFGYSQKDYLPGTITTNNGENLKGLILWGNSRLNSESCIFKELNSENPKIFSADEIISYKFDNSSYYISQPIDNAGKNEKVFLELLIKGKLNVYRYTDSLMNFHYYVQKEGEKILELHNTKKDENVSNFVISMEQKEYIHELVLLLKDYPELYSQIEGSIYNDESLVKIAKSFHNLICKNEKCIVYERPKRKKIITYGFISDFYSSRLNLTKIIDINYLSFNQMKTMNTLAGGLFLNVSNFDLFSPRFSTLIEAEYLHPYFQNVIGDTLVAFNQLRTSFQLKYSIPIKKFFPKASIGLIYNLRGKNEFENRILLVKMDEYTSGYYNLAYYLNTNHHQFGFTSMIGTDYFLTEKLSCSLSLKYEYCMQFIGYANDPSYNHNFLIQLGIGYRIH